jgi:hypothetical protein
MGRDLSIVRGGASPCDLTKYDCLLTITEEQQLRNQRPPARQDLKVALGLEQARLPINPEPD